MADFITISAHKIGGLMGTGALITRDSVHLHPLIQGGGQEKRMRSGTQNLLGIMAFGYAVSQIDHGNWQDVACLRDYLEESIKAIEPSALVINSDTPRLPNITVLKMLGSDSQTQVINFDLEGIAVSHGSACSSGKLENSHVMNAMGIYTNDTIRISLGLPTTKQEIDSFIKVWEKLYNKSRQKYG